MKAAALALLLRCALGQFTPTPHGALVTVGDLFVELAVEGTSYFRLSVNNASAPSQVATSMVAPKTAWAPYTVAQSGAVVKLTAPSLGTLSIDTSSGVVVLASPSGAVLTTSSPLVTGAVHAWPTRAGGGSLRVSNDTCAPGVRHTGTDVSGPVRSKNFPNGLSGQTLAQCCGACNSDPTCISWVWSDGTHPDPAGNCWPLSSFSGTHAQDGRTLGGFAPPPPPPPPGTAVFSFSSSPSAVFMAAGTDGGGAQTLARTGAQAQVFNTGSWTPSFYSTDGWSMFAVSPFVNTAAPGKGNGVYPVRWQTTSTDVVVSIMGGSGAASTGVDIYLTPSPGLREHVIAQAALQGPAVVPPRWSFGFMACRWGWVNQSYIEGVLQTFRSLQMPLDVMISDFEWFTIRPDYSLPSQGDPNYHDFEWNNVTWPAPAAALVARYRSQYNTRFGGIRKPRLGNSDLLIMAQSKGWLMGQGGDPAGQPDGSRNVNFSQPELFEWYSTQNSPYLIDGTMFFWNDEGEDDFFTFTDWSRSQLVGQEELFPGRRYFSINRAFSPGAASLGAIVWTGDIQPQWQDLQRTPGYAINWGIAGAPYVTCDTGGFSGETNALLLVRWYAVSALLTTMRVHSTNSATPHFPFPFLWGQEASLAMQSLLQLRYTLIPHLYSLAHSTYTTGELIVRPLAYEFPADAEGFSMTSQWLVGPSILVAPVLSPDNVTLAYLPIGASWFEWGSSTLHPGGTTLQLSSVPLAAVPVYVRAGSILTLAPPVQYTDALPGGPLQVMIYAGSDATFEFVEDDGETTGYTTGATTQLLLSWADAAGCLSWSVSGASPNPAGEHAFTQLAVSVHLVDGSTKTASAVAIGDSGRTCPT